MSDSASTGMTGKISIHLLDSATGQAIQTWRFENSVRVRIGRSEENHIVISDPSVSRFHAELTCEGSYWQVVNFGRNGIHVGGTSVSQAPVQDHTTFRLGASGPLLRVGRCEAPLGAQNTIIEAPLQLGPAIKIDEAQKDLQVREIAESDYFQQLKRASQKLRAEAQAKEPT